MTQRRTKKRVARAGHRRSLARPRKIKRTVKKTSRLAVGRKAAGGHPALASGRQRAPEKFTDPKATQQLRAYEMAVKCFHQQKFDRARELFEKVLTGPSKELAERSQVHLNICRQKLTRVTVQLKSADDHYYYAVSMINLGRYDEARAHLLRARRAAPKADFVHYAMATLACISGDTEAALEHLHQAINLRPENRIHARYDEDFDILREDPRFTELIYPERDLPS